MITRLASKINVIPATRRAAGGLPRAGRHGPATRSPSACEPALEARRTLELDVDRAGRRQPLAHRVAADGRDRAPGSASRTRAPRRCRPCCPRSPTRAGGAPRSPTASPTASSRSATRRCTSGWPLIHGDDERIDVRDLGFAARSSTSCRGGCWHDATDAGRPAKLRLGGMALAQRPARARPDALGRRRARADGASGSPRAASRGCAPPTACRACAACCASARPMPSSRSSSAACREARLPFQHPSVRGRHARRHRRRRACSSAASAAAWRRGRRRARLPRARAVHPARRRGRPVPRGRAQGDRRLRAGRRGRRRRRPRSTSAAARTSSRPMMASNVAGNAAAAPRARAPERDRQRRRRAGLHGRRRRGCSPGASATTTRARRARPARPGFAIQRAVGTREPDERQLEVGRAALDEILRAEGAGVADPIRPAADDLRLAAGVPEALY